MISKSFQFKLILIFSSSISLLLKTTIGRYHENEKNHHAHQQQPHHHDLFPRGQGQKGDLAYYFNNIGAIGTDLMKNEDPKEDCVFYVNSYNSTREKSAAIAFADIRNVQSANGGGVGTANTLYDAFDLDVAFGDGGTLMRQATAAGPTVRRKYFKVTSGKYAEYCRGTVWLIVKPGEIYHDAIWLTDEYPALTRPGSGVTAIYEIDPANVEWAELQFQNGNPNPNFNPRLYRGGQPPGARPPRDPANISYNWNDAKGAQGKIDQYSKYPDVADGYLPDETNTPSPECDMNQPSRVPWNVFTGTFSKFCDATLKNPINSLAQIVDNHGFEIPPKKSKRSLSNLIQLNKRAPPPNPDDYNAYTFEFQWSGGKGSCYLSCNDAYQKAANSPCGHTAGEQNIMATSGSIDAGCGKYTWKINKPPGTDPKPEAPTVKPVHCNAADAFGKHGDINPGFQNQYTGFACAGTARITIKPDSNPITFSTRTNGVPYNYKVSWVKDCKSTVSEMNAYQPLPNDSKNNCISLLRRAYTDCNNGGVGGYIDVGCVRYEFHP